jgi:hypothetical protein
MSKLARCKLQANIEKFKLVIAQISVYHVRLVQCTCTNIYLNNVVIMRNRMKNYFVHFLIPASSVCDNSVITAARPTQNRQKVKVGKSSS